MKRYYIADFQEGAKVEDVFLIASKSVGSTRSGSPFLKVKLGDKTGTIDAVKWDATETELGSLREQDFVLVHGAVRAYNGDLQLTLDTLRKYSDHIDPTDFLPASPRDPEEMFTELRALLKQIANPHLNSVLTAFFGDKAFAERFGKAPAATKIHHAYIGGLLEHTLNVVNNCIALAGLYSAADRDLLVTAAALHDVGKVEEFEWSVAIKYSDAGHLVGHVVGGAMMVKKAADAIKDFDPILNLALQHAILAHHGMKEYGSPKQPKSIEAMILHAADDLDAKVAMYQNAVAESDRNGDLGLFTKRHFILDRPMFKGVPVQKKEKPAEPGELLFDADLFAADDYDPFSE